MQLFAPPIPGSETLAEIAYREADHRAKNSIQLAVSILQLQARQAGSEIAACHLEAASRRLAAIAAAHDLGDEPRRTGIAVDKYLARICGSVVFGDRISFDLSAEHILLPPRRAIPLGLITSEAVTNALRHAFSEGDIGRIRIVLRKETGNQLLLLVQDNGRGRTAGRPDGLGTQLIKRLAKQLQGKTAFGAPERGGSTFSLRFPLQENQDSQFSVPQKSSRRCDRLDFDFLKSVAALHQPRIFHAGESIVEENAPVSDVLVVVDGIAATHRSSPEGTKRIISFHFPGDITNLQCDLGPVPYGVSALIDCRVNAICLADLDSVLGAHPEFLRVLWRAAIIESSILKEWVWFSGQHRAALRVAHLLCEFLERYDGHGESHNSLLPLTQVQIADACGLSTIHVNRILRQFRQLGIELFAKGKIRVTDVTALHRLCRFRRDYLHKADEAPVFTPGARTPG